jgi:hypothetical protein
MTTVTINPLSLPTAKLGKPYVAELTAAGFPAAATLTWSTVSGSLPAGLAFANGKITGTPTAEGESVVKFKVTDGTDSAEKEYRLQVAKPVNTAVIIAVCIGVVLFCAACLMLMAGFATPVLNTIGANIPSIAAAPAAGTAVPAETGIESGKPAGTDGIESGKPAGTDGLVIMTKENFPYQTKVVKDDKGRSVTVLSGFDIKEFGGTMDPGCKRKELDFVELREEVGSESEKCAIVLEWSLKNGDTTIASGVYSLLPGEWIRFPFAQTSGYTRFVGTLHYQPYAYNAHMYSADVIGDWQEKNPGLFNVGGLSPTDEYIQGLFKQSEAVAP